MQTVQRRTNYLSTCQHLAASHVQQYSVPVSWSISHQNRCSCWGQWSQSDKSVEHQEQYTRGRAELICSASTCPNPTAAHKHTHTHVHTMRTASQVTWLVITEVRSESFGLVTERCHDVLIICAVSHTFAYWTSSTAHVRLFIIECAIARFLCTMHVFDVRASSSSLCYPCAKFRFCHALHWWASQWRKITYSIIHSPSLFDSPGTEGFT